MAETNKKICDTHIFSPFCLERFLPVQQVQGAALKRLDISLAGISMLRKTYSISRVKPNWHVLLYTLKGRGKLRTENGETTLGAGTVAFLPRHTTHSYALDGKNWEILWFHMRPMETWRHLESHNWSVGQARYLDLLKPAFQGLLRESEHGDEESRRAGELYAELIAIYLKRELNYTHSAAEWETREKLRALWSQMEASLQEDWPIARMARRAHVSSGHFHRLVQEVYGATPMEKLTALRMHRAESLLRTTNLTAYVIAELVGYTNPYAFSIACKRFFGRGPRELRNGG